LEFFIDKKNVGNMAVLEKSPLTPKEGTKIKFQAVMIGLIKDLKEMDRVKKAVLVKEWTHIGF